jgi:hypothetical protein
MRNLAILVAALAGFSFTNRLAAEPPRGTVLELHSCELYAGGCVVSSEAPLGGRYMLRAWNFTGGDFAGTELAGLQVALLQTSSENLAAPNAEPGQAVVYLPQNATSSERGTLLAWLKSAQPELKSRDLQTRVAPLRFAKTEIGYSFSAGEFVTVTTAALESCEAGACGEALWYTPRTLTSLFTVAVDRASQVSEPLLKLKWTDAGKRSIFLAKFGAAVPAQNLYVSTAELCGPKGLF